MPAPNDPTTKNYIVDAMTGSFYSDAYWTGTHVDPVAYGLSVGAYTQATIQEIVAGVRGGPGK